jgi:hypothetical protein
MVLGRSLVRTGQPDQDWREDSLPAWFPAILVAKIPRREDVHSNMAELPASIEKMASKAVQGDFARVYHKSIGLD